MSDGIMGSKNSKGMNERKRKDTVPPSWSLQSCEGERLQSNNPISKREIVNNGVTGYTDRPISGSTDSG